MILKTIATTLTALCITGAAQAETVEIYLLDKLDNTQNGYCVDISGGQGPQANPDNGLQGHTCYSPSGRIFVDQAFDSAQVASGTFYMPEFDVCMQVSSKAVGAALELASCEASEEQSFIFDGEGTISPASAPQFCLTLGRDTRSGRSTTNQIKALTLADCSGEDAAYQVWGYRTAE